MKACRIHPLATAIATLSLMASTGYAQQATDQEGGEPSASMEEVITRASPIESSRQAALDSKRYADNFKDVLSADAIGQFPDQNLADSLGRVPGLAIERDQGQARFINLRGTPFRYTSIAFDGISVPGAQNGRIPRFDSFPSAIISKVDVNKAVLPSMPGEAVAGHINIETFNPFDQKGTSMALDVGRGEQTYGGGNVEQGSIRGSWSGKHLGVMAFASTNSREQQTDNREYELEPPSGASDITVNELDFRNYHIERESTAYGGRVEYRGDGALERIFLNSLYSEFEDREQRNQFVFGFENPTPGETGQNRTANVSRWLEYGTYTNSTFVNTLGADLGLGEWDIEARYAHTETEFDTYLPIVQSVGAQTSTDYDLGKRNDPKLELSQSLDSLQYSDNRSFVVANRLDIDADTIKLDSSRELTLFDRFAELDLGLQFDSRTADGGNETSVGGFPDSINIKNYNTGKRWDTNHTTNTIDGTVYDNPGLRNAWEATGALDGFEFSDSNVIALEEDITSTYGMLTNELSWGSLTSGVRVEHTDYTSTGTLSSGPVQYSDTFTDVLPSAHANVNLADDMKLRLSGSTGVNRPTYNEWRASVSLDVPNQTASGGNPKLKPEEARGFDVSYEWYFAPASLFSTGAFYREIDNVIFTDVTTVDGGRFLDSAQGEDWELNASVNGDDGEYSGLEANLSVQELNDLVPMPVRGFGFSTNATLSESQFTRPNGTKSDLPGTSDLIWNASVFYERYGLSARINYQYRDEWISPLEDPDDVWGEQERVDASISYRLPVSPLGGKFSVYANGKNLTDEVDTRYSGNGTINQAESYGRTFLAGIRFNY